MTEKPIRSGRKAQEALAYTLQRDHGICWICGHPGADSRDHIIPVDIDPTRANDPTNWAAAHGSARPDLNCPGQYARGNYAGPRRPTTTPGTVTVVIGPPTAGKSTHVQQHRNPGDIIVDHDALAQALGSPDHHTSKGPHAAAARIARDAVIQHLLDGTTPGWIIHTAPGPAQLDRYTRANVTALLLDPGQRTCLTRARTEREPWTIPAIRSWYTDDQHRLTAWATTHTPTPTTHTTSEREW